MNLDLLLKIVSTLATLAIGIAASMLAYRQYSINRAKLRFDLYEKRIALLSTLGQFISEVVVGDFTMSPEQSQRVTQLYNSQTSEIFEVFKNEIAIPKA